MKNKDDNSIIYFLANLSVYITIYVISLRLVFDIINNTIARIILVIALLIICGYLEEKIISRLVNEVLEKILKKDNKKGLYKDTQNLE